jgi:hypothetical protein
MVVRVAAIRGDRFTGRKIFYSRLPLVGDIGAVLDVHEKPELGYEVECCDPTTGTTIWLEAMYPDEIEACPDDFVAFRRPGSPVSA